MRLLLSLALLALVGACSKPATPAKRVTLNRHTGTTFDLVPSEGQGQYCLAYTVSMSGLVRQLTMSKSNMSFECAPNKPIGNRTFKVPLNEGPVKVYVLFTSQAVNAGSVSQQILEADNRQALSAMNLRLPGSASLEALDFEPQEEVAAEVGGVVGGDGGVEAPAPATEDAGAK